MRGQRRLSSLSTIKKKQVTTDPVRRSPSVVACSWKTTVCEQTAIVVDRRAVIHRSHRPRYKGTASADDPLQARALGKEFKVLWETASPNPKLRRLHL